MTSVHVWLHNRLSAETDRQSLQLLVLLLLLTTEIKRKFKLAG